MPKCPGSPGGPAHPPVPSSTLLPVSCRGPGLPDGALRETLPGPKRNQKEPSGIHLPELTRNFLTTAERRDNEFIIHNINSACLLVLYEHTLSPSLAMAPVEKLRKDRLSIMAGARGGKTGAGNTNPVRTWSGKEKKREDNAIANGWHKKKIPIQLFLL